MSLFESTDAPLADKVRPRALAELIGQEHLVGPGKFLRQIIESGQPVSVILWGPPGSGKTTLARIMAASTNAAFEEVSAVVVGLPEVKKVIERAKERRRMGQSTILFVDEIHRFNKAQQDAFLPHVETGTIILIGATTENPSFEVISPLLSRSRVLTLESLSPEQLQRLLTRATGQLTGVTVQKPAIKLLAELAAGDARVALGGLEAAAQVAKVVTPDVIKQAMQKTSLRYDKGGEFHYNLISAFIKSMRGSAPDAALFYLARMLEAGEDPKFIARRIVIFASEDIGMADPTMLPLAVSAFQAVERVGLPEGKLTLAQATIAMATAPKSRDVATALSAAVQAVRDNPAAEPPLHLRNAPTKLMKELGYGKGTKWEPGFEHPKGFMLEGLEKQRFYKPDHKD
ncbi:MAG TPA: replication-associated recombination protein A [Candidatus Saccharimonadales bacterium]|nr:replication-associated recombination protein A [Candidatus Saccharimonadales bacterium]